jgi:hypothetical protein
MIEAEDLHGGVEVEAVEATVRDFDVNSLHPTLSPNRLPAHRNIMFYKNIVLFIRSPDVADAGNTFHCPHGSLKLILYGVCNVSSGNSFLTMNDDEIFDR